MGSPDTGNDLPKISQHMGEEGRIIWPQCILFITFTVLFFKGSSMFTQSSEVPMWVLLRRLKDLWQASLSKEGKGGLLNKHLLLLCQKPDLCEELKYVVIRIQTSNTRHSSVGTEVPSFRQIVSHMSLWRHKCLQGLLTINIWQPCAISICSKQHPALAHPPPRSKQLLPAKTGFQDNSPNSLNLDMRPPLQDETGEMWSKQRQRGYRHPPKLVHHRSGWCFLRFRWGYVKTAVKL